MDTYKNGRDIEKSRASRRRWYHSHRESEIKRIRRRSKSIQDWFQDHKKTLACSRCGYNRCSEALEFHHRDPSQKELDLATAIRYGWKIERILLEIDKCDVLCANCHREVEHSGVG